MTLDQSTQEIVDASHILAAEDILDAFGHVSRRSPTRSDRFLMSRSLAPALVTTDDIVELDFDGTCVSDPSARVFLERFIHSEIYRSRPDVAAIVHSHALSVIPFTVLDAAPVRPVFHMCGFLHGAPAPFDLADHAGPASDLLVRDPRLGAALADHLGAAAIVLMRGHGFTAVGDGVAQATYRAIYAAKNCTVQSAAMAMGTPLYLTGPEAEACDRAVTSQLDRAWDLWRKALGREK
ncbi:class II aldolase/adducin family protein [Bradyrhizobium sp. WSM3983]|uniref:class II aldolase/adducin family protein n=1 Tax=Bradyrhizobium sp. WSM3983 TaxID=1038867 RepID=UPI000559DC42|nr:class II aldolase/adducin family protein [Bradyrhizobium sp. WSM3983]